MSEISVRFWGVRGSVPCPGRETVRYGGNTACVEVRCGDRLVIFDAGTGLRALGHALAAGPPGLAADIFISHCHIDHVAGLPFFEPCYTPASQIRIWAGSLLPEQRLADVARILMSAPLFPSGAGVFKAKIKFCDFHSGDVLEPYPGVTLRTAALVHPGRATGYRLEYRSRSVAYVTDTEHSPGRIDPEVLALAEAADLLIYDCNYTDEEFAGHVGRGHSTWEEGVRIAETAGAHRLAIFHHDPNHDDEFLDGVKARAAQRHPGAIVAAEGLIVSL